MTACLKKDASACIGMATRLGHGRLEHVEIKLYALQHWGRQGRLSLDKVTTTEQLADIMTKTLFIPDVINFVSENWLDKMCNRSLNLRIRAKVWRCSQGSHINFNDHLRWDVFSRELDKLSVFCIWNVSVFLNSWHVGCCASLHPRGVR